LRKLAPWVLSLALFAGGTTLSGCALLPNATTLSTGTLHPPSWIVGTWADSSGVNTLEFSSTNAMFKIKVGFIDMPVDLSSTYSGGLSDSTAGTRYTIDVDKSGTSATYTFDRINDTSLSYTNITNGTKAGTLTLNRK